MKKSYKEIDTHYAQIVSDLTKESAIEYLESVIDKNHKILTVNGNLISKLRRLDVIELIESAQIEIKKVHNFSISKTEK